MMKSYPLLLALTLPLAAAPPARAAESAQPNILFIFSDDHAQRLIGAYDGSINKTPNIDRLAREGALFNNSFNANSICCPSRASILTGKHSHANGVLGNSSKWNTSQWSYPRDLGKTGYQTALIGKWHMKGNPTDEFQHWEILSGHGGQGSYYNPEYISPSGPSKVTGYEADITTDKALDWLKDRNPSKPFLLAVQYKAPHTPRTPGPKHMDSYDGVTFPEPATLFDDYSTRQPFVSKTWMALKGMKGDGLNIGPTKEEIAANPERIKELGALKGLNAEQMDAWHKAYDPRNREYQKLLAEGKLEGKAGISYKYQRYISDSIRCVDGLDENIGRLLDYLDETGLSKNTIVVYSTDQGFFTGEHGWAEKRWMYEESFRSPLLIRWPGTIKPGTRIDALVQNIDLAPTLLTAAGAQVPPDVQGRALQPVLGGNIPPDWRKDLLYTYYDGGTPEARGEYNMPRMMGVRDDRYKLISYYDYKAWEFYDLQKDPTELKNLYDDPAYAKEVERLKGRLAALKAQYQVPEPPPLVPKKARKRQPAQEE